MSTPRVNHDPYQRRPEDYLFGKRIADERGKPSFQFRSTDKKVSDFTRINQGSGDVGPGMYSVPTTVGKSNSFNVKSTFGEPHVRTALRRCQLNDEVRWQCPPTRTEITTNVHQSLAKEWQKPSFNRKGTWGEPPAKALKRTQLDFDNGGRQGTGEFTSKLYSSFKVDDRPSAWGRRPQTPEKRDAYIRNKSATRTEYTTGLHSSIQVAEPSPRRATTPITSRGGRLDLVPKHRFVTQTEYTTPLSSTLRVPPPTPVQRQRHLLETKKTDSWLRVKAGEDTGPGPGQYFIP